MLDCDQFGQLPRSLRNLKISKNITGFDEKLAAGSLFEDLPTSLRSLSLAMVTRSDDEGEDDEEVTYPPQRLLNVLPVLETLELKRFVTMPSSFVRELPRSLTKVDLGDMKLSMEDAKFLPPGLRALNFAHFGITPEVAPYWPIGVVGSLNRASFDLMEPRIRRFFH